MYLNIKRESKNKKSIKTPIIKDRNLSVLNNKELPIYI